MLSSRVTAAISSSTTATFLFNNPKISSKKFPYISNPLNNSAKSIKWNCRNSRMEKSASSFVTKASAQPLTNPGELIDSVETFIFDCDGVNFLLNSLYLLNLILICVSIQWYFSVPVF